MTPFERADEAGRLLKNEVLRDAFAAIREGLIHQIEHAPLSDVELQQEIALMLQLLKRVQSQLSRYVEDGKLEQYRQKQQSFMDRIRERL